MDLDDRSRLDLNVSVDRYGIFPSPIVSQVHDQIKTGLFNKSKAPS
jgi:hypothetical protein